MAEVTDPQTKALEFFKDWSNYLLVTTVAAVGWVAGKDHADFCSPGLQAICIVAFTLSIVFGILTLALVPLVQEQRKGDKSNYEVEVVYEKFWAADQAGACRLKTLCFPQHAFFLLGVVVFAAGTIWGKDSAYAQDHIATVYFAVAVVVAAALLSIAAVWTRAGAPQAAKPKRKSNATR